MIKAVNGARVQNMAPSPQTEQKEQPGDDNFQSPLVAQNGKV